MPHRLEQNPEIECISCGADFRWDESDDDHRCAECSAWHAWWVGTREQGDVA